MSLGQRLREIRERVGDAAHRAGRSPEDITLVAVCKRQPFDRILEAHQEGIRDFGENTVQGLCATHAQLQDAGKDVRWHFVGGLQRNKVNKLIDKLHLLHTVDRDELAEQLSRKVGPGTLPVLVQVNIGEESQKGGVLPDQAVDFARSVGCRENLKLLGLMGMPPKGQNPAPFFRRLAQLGAQLTKTPEGVDARHLSMGMTEDFETAIRWGSTQVRIGTAIFGERQY